MDVLDHAGHIGAEYERVSGAPQAVVQCRQKTRAPGGPGELRQGVNVRTCGLCGGGGRLGGRGLGRR